MKKKEIFELFNLEEEKKQMEKTIQEREKWLFDFYIKEKIECILRNE